MSVTLTANASAGAAFDAMTTALIESMQTSADGRASEAIYTAWTAAQRSLTDTITAHLASDDATVGQLVATPDGPLTIARASSMFGFLLSGDGQTFTTEAWCTCGGPGRDTVRVERWGAAGREFHGFAHAECRKVTQSG